MKTMAEMESSLQWLRSGSSSAGLAAAAGAGAASAQGAKDSDKIGVQLLLDCRALAAEMDSLQRMCLKGDAVAAAADPAGKEAELSRPYSRLLETLASFSQLAAASTAGSK